MDLCYFFFQAEDGIRDKLVTGVQTCALPILHDAFFFHAEDGIRDKLVTGVQTCALPILPPLEVLGQKPVRHEMEEADLHRSLRVASMIARPAGSRPGPTAGSPGGRHGCRRSRAGYRGWRVTPTSSRKRYSMPVPRNVSIASSGVFTMGCPLTLKLVFKTIARPVSVPTARRSAWNAASSFADTVCTRAEPFTWVIAGSSRRCASRTSTVTIMYGSSVPGGTSNHVCTSSRDTAGANRRNAPRLLPLGVIPLRLPRSPGPPRD